KYIESSYLNSSSGSGFPVEEDFLKEYLNYKVKSGKIKAFSLEQYIMNIKAHNEALGHSWNYSIFDVIIKEALDLLMPKQVDNSVSPNSGIPPPQSSDFSDAQSRQLFSEFNLQEGAVSNSDAHPYLPSGFGGQNFVSLPT
ncbi:18925_t:CDS:1, partial [Gigaspora rosea]